MTFTNPIPKNGKIVMSLNKQFLTISTNCIINSGVIFEDLNSVKCENIAGDSKEVLTIHAFESVTASSLMWVSIDITNPIIDSKLPVSVESFNEDNQLIDKGELLIEISKTIGKASEFNAYPVQRESDLEAGKRGPF
jgi:hypothetical protein